MSGAGQGRYDRSRAETTAFTAQDLNRKISNIVRYGVIEKIAHDGARVRVRIGPNLSTWLPWHEKHAGEDSTWAPPSAGEQVTVFSPSGNLAQAVMLGGLYSKKFDQPGKDKNQRIHKLKDGTTITHDVKEKTRVTKMPDEGAHTIKVNKQEQQVDKEGTRLKNDKGTVKLDKDGKITKQNEGGGIVIDPGGKIIAQAKDALLQKASNILAQASKISMGGGQVFINC